MQAVWGAGKFDAPPSIFHIPEEFRRQGHLYRGARWLSIDESKPAMGMEEDAFKLFVSFVSGGGGGSLCLRKNSEAETHYDNWSRRGETWAMNPDDIPRVASAMESPYKRRLR